MFLYEFLWRGRADAATPPAYHVILAVPTKDGFGRDRIDFTDALTPGEAEAVGFPLPAVLAAINGDALNEIAKVRADLQAVEARLAGAEGRAAAAEAALEAAGRRPQRSAEPASIGAAG